jgi:hypothetical protein
MTHYESILIMSELGHIVAADDRRSRLRAGVAMDRDYDL